MLPTDSDADLAAIRNDLAALRSDINSLIADLNKGAQNAANQISDDGQQSAKIIGAWIEERPWLTVLIALGAGYVGIRALLR